ncbi:peroxynitrite isomerase THAP4-like, partial [Amblyomma americanum]
TVCCAFGCSTCSGRGKRLFSVPLGKRDKKRTKVWLDRIGRSDFSPNKSSKLCEHFTADQFEPPILLKHGIKKLKPTAVPSLFCHQPHKTGRKLPVPCNGMTSAL